uniref:Uncharacterized protein n=2 Tax=Aureoumbra lagunensis TaxID=44058 RepID=A0A7S3K024_9STRA
MSPTIVTANDSDVETIATVTSLATHGSLYVDTSTNTLASHATYDDLSSCYTAIFDNYESNARYSYAVNGTPPIGASEFILDKPIAENTIGNLTAYDDKLFSSHTIKIVAFAFGKPFTGNDNNLSIIIASSVTENTALLNRSLSFAHDDEEPSLDQNLVVFEDPADDNDLAVIEVMFTTRIALRRVKNTITFKFDIVLDDTTVSIIVSIDCLDTEHPAQSTHSTATTTTRYGTRLIDATRSDTVTVHADIFPDFAAIVKQLLFLFGRHTTIRNELDLVYVNHDAVLEHFVVALGTSCNTSLPIPTEIADTDANVVSLDVHEALAILQPFVFDHRMRTLYYATTSDSANSSDTSAPATTPTDISTVPPCLNTIDATGDILDIGTTASHTPNAETVETEVIDTPDTVTLSSDTSITNRHNSLVSTRPVPAITTSCMSKADIDPPSRDASETANPDTDEQMIFLNNLLEQNQSLKAKFLDLKNILIDHLISSNSDSNDSSAHLTTDSSKSVTPTHDLVSEGVQTIVANQVNHNATLILDHDLNLNALRSMTTGVMSKATTWRTVFDATQAICDDIRFDLNTLLSESTLIESLQADDSFTFNSIARRCQILFDQQAALCKDIDSIHADRDTLLEHLASVSENLYALCQNGLSICSNSVDTTDFLVEYCTSFVEAFDITINQLTGFINALDVALSSNDFDTLIVTGQHITAHVQTLVKLLDKQFDLCCFDIQLLNQRLLKYQNDIVENLTSSQLDCDPTSSSLDHNAQCIVSEITSSVSNRSTRSYDDATRSTEATMPHCLGKSIDTGSLTAMPNVLAVECAVYYVREVTTLVFSVSSNHLVPDSVTYQEVLSWIKDALATKTHDTLPLFKEYLLSRYNKLKLFLQSDLSCT